MWGFFLSFKLKIALTSEVTRWFCLRTDALSLMKKLLVLALICSLIVQLVEIRSWQPWHVKKCLTGSSIKVHKECCMHLIRFKLHHVLFAHRSCNCQDTSNALFCSVYSCFFPTEHRCHIMTSKRINRIRYLFFLLFTFLKKYHIVFIQTWTCY